MSCSIIHLGAISYIAPRLAFIRILLNIGPPPLQLLGREIVLLDERRRLVYVKAGESATFSEGDAFERLLIGILVMNRARCGHDA